MLREDVEKALAHQKALKKLEEKPEIPTENYFLHFGYTLKKQRYLHGITMQQLADASGTFKSRISEYETGKRIPNKKSLEVLISSMKLLGADEQVDKILSEAFDKTLLHRKKAAVAAVFRVDGPPIFKILKEKEKVLKAMELEERKKKAERKKLRQSISMRITRG